MMNLEDLHNWPPPWGYDAPEGAYYGHPNDCDGVSEREEFYERLAAEDEQRREALG